MLAVCACAPAANVSPSSSVDEHSTTSPSTIANDTEKQAPSYAKASASKLASLDDHAWPPSNIPTDAAAKTALEDEGEWQAFDRKWMHVIAGAPPTFYTTTVRPDPNRQAKVQVVALDARQLDLDMTIGVEGPFPPDEATKGKWPRGGMLPREKKIATRVIAAFNGGFRFDQGAWGMMVDRRQFLPPVKNVASILVHDDGRLGFGSWGPTMKTPDEVRTLRQNLDPLIDDGVINPRKRLRWGGIKAQGVQVGQRAKRTGICRTSKGDFLYLWGNDLEAQDLGVAMKKAGCDYGLHLDMNVFHVGFVFMSFEDESYEKGESEILSSSMGANKKRYIKQPSPKEFFYATLREPLPSTLGNGLKFTADTWPQPPPTWMPSVLIAAESEVKLTFFAGSRIRAHLVGGHDELGPTGQRLVDVSPPSVLGGDDAERVLAAVSFGVATKTSPYGLVLDGVERSMPAISAAARLAIDDAGRLSILLPGEATTARGSLQAPLLIVDGKALDAPPDLVFALGLTAKGDVIVAEKKSSLATSATILGTLVRAGCVRAIGARSPTAGKVERIGRDPILVGGAETRIFVLGNKPEGATYRFDLDDQGKPRWPKVTTPVPVK